MSQKMHAKLFISVESALQICLVQCTMCINVEKAEEKNSYWQSLYRN